MWFYYYFYLGFVVIKTFVMEVMALSMSIIYLYIWYKICVCVCMYLCYGCMQAWCLSAYVWGYASTFVCVNVHLSGLETWFIA